MSTNLSREQEISQQLIDQIGCYSDSGSSISAKDQKEDDLYFVSERLKSVQELEKFYDGINDYQKNYSDSVFRYTSQHGITGFDESISKGQFFREQFVRYMAALNETSGGEYAGDPRLREDAPQQATTTMKKLLGKEGFLLYKLALEEEMNSKEYRNAVFRASTTHYDGQSWEKRPLIIVSGPSACGKTFAANAHHNPNKL